MPVHPSSAATRLPLTTLICCLFNLGGALLVLFGWIAGMPALFQPLRGAAPVVPLTALTVFAGTAALANIALAQSGSALGCLRQARWLSLSVIAIGVLVLAEYLLGLRVGIESLLLRGRVAAVVQDIAVPGRLSPQAAIAALVYGVALFGMSRPFGRGGRDGGWLIAVGMLVPGLALVGHFVEQRDFYTFAGLSEVAMALPTAIMLLVLGAGALALADPLPYRAPRPAGPESPQT